MKMLIKKTSIVALVATAAYLAPSLAQAQFVLINDTFESYTLDSSLNGQRPPDGNPNNWSVSSTTERDFVAIAGSSTGGTAPNQQVGNLFKNNTTSDFPATSRLFPDAVSTADVHVSFKFRVNSTGTNGGSLQFQIGAADGSSPVLLRLDAGDKSLTLLPARNGPGDGGRDRAILASGDLIQDNWYELTIIANPVAQTISASVVNLETEESGTTWTDQWFRTNVTQLNSFRIATNANSTGTINISIDDLMVTSAIPESGTYALLAGLGALLLLAFRHRR